jgi:hypothetical protein
MSGGHFLPSVQKLVATYIFAVRQKCKSSPATGTNKTTILLRDRRFISQKIYSNFITLPRESLYFFLKIGYDIKTNFQEVHTCR